MSTNNFYFENCLQVIEIGEGDDFVFDNAMVDIQSALGAEFKMGYETGWNETDGLRSYPGKVIFKIPAGIFHVEVIVRSGYYSHANVDWKIVESDEYFEVTGDEYEAAKAKAEKIGRKVTKVLKGFTTTLKKVAQFSNGEALYEIAK